MLPFIERAKCIKSIKRYFFGVGHGQSEGDSMHSVIERAKCIRSIKQAFFEVGQGQLEGDSMHTCSVIERAIQRVGEMMLPAGLACIYRMTRSHPKLYTASEDC